ncbi:hypothetical protein ASC92_22050 [Variovorax sp. Root411]|nr:hypothetical protein ASC92_22050 [Variovorax sp. Root411]
MAHASNAGCSCTPYRPAAQFKSFEWVQAERLGPSQQSLAAFLNDARDAVQGAHTLVQLLAWDEDRRDAALSDADPAPLFDACQRSALQRFLSVSLGLLHARIESQCEALTQEGTLRAA